MMDNEALGGFAEHAAGTAKAHEETGEIVKDLDKGPSADDLKERRKDAKRMDRPPETK